MTKYDWKEIIENRIPCYFYNSKPASDCNKKIGRLIAVSINNINYHKFKMSDDVCTIYCEPIRTEDKEKYEIKEKAKTWRPCKNWEEFKPFFGKTAVYTRAGNVRNGCYLLIDYYNPEEYSEYNDCTAGDWFRNYRLEDGSIIGIEEENK